MIMDAPLPRGEHEEFRKTVEAKFEAHDQWDKRQDRRIELLEESTKEIGNLAASVQKLAVSVESMAKQQAKESERLETLEGRDGEMWRKVVGYVLTAVVSIVIGFVFSRIGM